ncbi:MAG: N-methylhydantoinase [Solirubrobacteraceae bacterium]
MYRVGIDVGGTFTDLFAYDPQTGETLSAKVPTTVDNQAIGVMESLRAARLAPGDAVFLSHGTTTGLNALIERKGARTGLITTAGFRDVLEIMRTDRESGYDLAWRKPEPFVRRRLRREVTERVLADGTVETPLDEAGARQAIGLLRDAGADSVAVSLLHAYANPQHELRLRELVAEVAPGMSVSLSSDVNAELREFERTNTAVVDAYIKPTMVRYIRRLVTELAGGGFAGRLFLMQGNGGMVTAQRAVEKPIVTLSSGPAAGAIAGAEIARAAGVEDVVTFDVGGTSTDVSLIRGGRPFVTTSKQIEWGLPARVPMIDVVSVGAGGGSIAWIDQGGALKMGPHSAGSTPGPVSYGRGGTEPTLSDALLLQGVLGSQLAGGTLELDVEAARARVGERLAEPLGLSIDRVIAGMVEIAHTNMANAVRSVSVWKGIDPRDLALAAFGGGGAMVAGPVARMLGIPVVLVPPLPGNSCAMGTLMTDFQEDVAVAYLARAHEADLAAVNGHLATLSDRTTAALVAQGVDAAEVQLSYAADMRYQGQIHELSIALAEFPLTAAGLERAIAAFGDAYEEIYAIRLAEGVPEVVSLRVTATGAIPHYAVPEFEGGAREPEPVGTRAVLEGGIRRPVPIYERYALAPGAAFDGPAILEEDGSTIWVATSMRCEVDRHGNLLIHIDIDRETDRPPVLAHQEA